MIGTVIKEQYRILELIGEGGMGSVYMALDLELDRRVALKLLKGELADNSVLIQRFRDELRTLASFNHPNITTLFTSVTWKEHPVMVMELVEGETLQKMVERRGPIPADVCVPLVNQALAGVGSAHRKKIIHRDLKPANLMLNLDGVVKVMDFGIAKIQNTPGLTRTNTAIGTSLYMAPEQIRGSADARSDIYAMGVTLYELLAGRVPFLGDSQYDIEHAHIAQAPEPPTLYYPHIPTTVVDAVMRALAKDPAARFQTAEEFAAALGDGRLPQTVTEPRQIPLRPESTPRLSTAASTAASTAGRAASPAPAFSPVPTPAPTPAFIPTPTRHPTAPGPASRAEPVPEAVPQREVIPQARVVSPGRRRLLLVALVAAAILVLTVSGFWIHSLSDATPPMDAYKTQGAAAGGRGQSPSQTSSSTPPASIAPAPLPPFVPPSDAPAVEKPTKVAPRPNPPIARGYGLAGQWSGSYDVCEDNRSTRVTMKLAEPDPGRVSGSLSFSTPDGASGRCSLSGVFMAAGRKLTLKASSCSGSTPAYLSGNHISLLTYSGSELSGSVEPQEPCMFVNLKKD